MTNLKLISVIIFSSAMALGCATPYYGYTETEWQQLTEEERKLAIEEYEEIVALQKSQEQKDIHDGRTNSIVDRAVNGPKYGKKYGGVY